MKHTILFAFLLSLFFAACKKDDSTIIDDTPSYYDITDRTVETGGVTLLFVKTSDKQTELGVDNLPDSIKSTVSKIDDSLMMLVISAGFNAKPGIYPIKITVKTAAGSKLYDIKLTVKDSRDKFTGKYTAVYNSDPANPKLAENTIEIKADPNDGTKIIIDNLLYGGTSFTGFFIIGFDHFSFEGKNITDGIFSGYELSWESSGSFSPPSGITLIIKKGGEKIEYNVGFTRKE